MAATSAEVVGRYVAAFLELVDGKKQLDQAEKDFEAIERVLTHAPDIQKVLKNPVIPGKERQAFILALAAKMKLNPLTRNFLCVLVANRRLKLLSEILIEWKRALAEKRGETAVQVETAQKLSAGQKQHLQKQIRICLKQANADIRIEETINTRLLGGMILRIGSVMADFSVKTRLQKLSRAMEGI